MSFIAPHHSPSPSGSFRKHHHERTTPSYGTTTKWIEGGVVDPVKSHPNIP
jgi:hypothetical protein